MWSCGSMPDMASPFEEHYERLAASYDENWAFTPEFLDFITAGIVEGLDLQPSDKTADLGGGTGLYSTRIASWAGLQNPIHCIDRSEAMLSQVPAVSNVTTEVAWAESWAGDVDGERYDAIVMKEAIHHVDNPTSIIDGIVANRLAPQGRLLLVLLPTTVEYPLFDAALERLTAMQPDPHMIAGAMSAAGLRVRVKHRRFRLQFSLDRYCQMLQSRYMSVLSTFDDAELAAGIEEVRAKHLDDEFLEFDDRFVYVRGQKP